MSLIKRPQNHYLKSAYDSLSGFQLFSVCRQGAGFIVSILLAKSALTTEQIGVFEIWLYLGLVFTFLCFNGSLQAYANSLSGDAAGANDHRLFNIYLLNEISGLIICGLLYFVVAPFTPFVLSDIDMLGWVLFYLWLHLSASLLPYIFLVKDLRNWFAPYSAWYVIGYVTAISVPLFANLGMNGILKGMIIFATMEQILLISVVARYSVFKIHASYLWSFFKLSLPLTIYGGIGLLAQIFDAWLVDWYFDDLTIFAQFRYGARELPGALALAGAFTASLLVRLGSDAQKGLDRMKSGSKRLMHLFFPITWVLLICSPFLFREFYNLDFVVSAWVFNTYLLLMISRWIFPHAYLIAQEENDLLIRVSLIELAINVSLSIWLVSYFGLIGIALATTIAFGFEKIFLLSYAVRKYQMQLKDFVPTRVWMIYSIGTVVLYLSSFLIWK